MPRFKILLSACLTLGVLVAMRFVSVAQPEVGLAEAYHQRVREAAIAIPREVGPWRGVDVEVPDAAVTLLKPNVMVSRRYKNVDTGREISFLLAQCGDARDLEGHYPPNCYEGQGWLLDRTDPFVIDAGGRRITGQTYTFKRELRGWAERIKVMNVILLPTGEFGQGMKEVRQLAGTYRDRFYGAGQVQFVFDASRPEAEREAVAKLFLTELTPVLGAIASQPDSESE